MMTKYRINIVQLMSQMLMNLEIIKHSSKHKVVIALGVRHRNLENT